MGAWRLRSWVDRGSGSRHSWYTPGRRRSGCRVDMVGDLRHRLPDRCRPDGLALAHVARMGVACRLSPPQAAFTVPPLRRPARGH